MLKLGVCVFPEKPRNGARVVAYPQYLHEVLGHAGLAYANLEVEALEERLPKLGLLVTVGEFELPETTRDALRAWVERGGAWLSLSGLCGLGELFGAEFAKPPSQRTNWGFAGATTLGEGYLEPPASDSNELFGHLSCPLHFFNGLALSMTEGAASTVLATALDPHGRATGRPVVIGARVGQGGCLLIAPDVTGTIVRVQQGVGVTRDGVPAPDGTAPVTDGVLKCDDGAVLDWCFDRQEIPGAPGVKGFLQPVADLWRELVLRAIFHLADRAGLALPLLWYYPRNLDALAHMSHDSDGNDPGHAEILLSLVGKAGINTTWCVIAPGYPAELTRRIAAAGHELAMHYDAMSDDRPWGHEQFHRQWTALCESFGAAPVSNKNHYTRWEGDVECFEWCVEHGIQLDQSKGCSKGGEVGFVFGTCHPYFPLDLDGAPLDVLELTLPTQDLEVFAPTEAGAALLDAVIANNGVLHLLFHPGHTHKEPVAKALLDAVAAATARNLEWWTASRINTWERARRGVRWSAPDGGGLELQAPSLLKDATLLVSGKATAEPIVDGAALQSSSVTRWGHTFQAVVLDLKPGSHRIMFEA